jgi:hypothetical protein
LLTQFLIHTTTPTGWALLSRNYAAGASMIWNPRLAALRLR